MAESDLSAQPWGSMSSRPGIQGSAVAAPLLSTHQFVSPSHYQPHTFAGQYGAVGDPSVSFRSHTSPSTSSNHAPGYSPYPLAGGHQIYYHHNLPSTYHYQPAYPRLPPAFRNGNDEVSMNPGGVPDYGDTLSRVNQTILHNSPPFQPLHYQGFGTPAITTTGSRPYPRRQQLSTIPSVSPPRYPNHRTTQSGGDRTLEQVHYPQSPHRRASYRQHQHFSGRAFNSQERGSTTGPGSEENRSQRSSSPRSSNRRSFDRYQYDLSQSSTSSDAEEAAARAPPFSRARHRPREVRPRFFGHQHIDPNVATPRQIQELKERLPRRLPSELPEKMCKACDICQKDYSTMDVKATEEEEVAIELPCGHCFGEYCIFEWFDTCKTHKNKVTCPMCRKQLVEPPRYPPAILSVMSRHPQAFQELLANELRGDFPQM